MAMRHANDPIPSVRALQPDVPEHLELVVRVALAKSPAARFASAYDLAKALVSGIVPETVPVVSTVPQRRIAVQSRRTGFTWSRALSLLTLTSLLFGLAGTLFFVSSLPHGIGDITGFPFGTGGWPGGSSLKSGSTAVTASATSRPPWEAGRPTAAHPTATPGSGGGLRGSKTPTPIQSSTPVINGTVPVNPIGTPIPTVAPFNCVTGTLAIDGSSNLEPLLQQVNNDYAASCPGLSFSLGGDGSRAALNYLQRGQIDLADTDLTANPARNLIDHPVAALLYALIVSSDVQVSGLSSAEIQGIYAGRITNWSQVGGPDEAVTVIRHLPNDTINTIFRTFVLNGANEHVKKVKLKGNWASVVQAVAQTQGAISYAPLVMAENANVQILAIDGAFPSVQAVISGSYSFWSVEHFYTQGDGTAQAQAYMQFFSSIQEENVLPQYGAVPIAIVPQDVLASHLPGPEI
jgi:phosphate transport system substrate-binding protein